MKTFPQRLSIGLLLATALLIGIVSALWMQDSKAPAKHSLGGDFTLQSNIGPVALSDFRDKLVMIFFGYTHCPDVCPVTLANVKVALKQLPPEKAQQVQTLFISVDPERDNVEHLAAYVDFFDKRFIGLTGSKVEIDQVIRQYGGFYRLVETPESAMAYTVDHSSRLYLLDKNGQIARFLYHDASSSDIAQAIDALL